MADMIVAYRVMPEDSETEYSVLESKVKEVVTGYDDSVEIKECKEEDVSFGILACAIEIQIDENCGSEDLENKLKELNEVADVIVTKMDRL